MTDQVPITISPKNLAELLEITPQRIIQLVNDGRIPKPKVRGKYLLWESIRGYIRFLKSTKKFNESKKGEEATRDEEELRKVKGQANKLEIDNAVVLKELLPVDDVADFYYSIAVIFGTQLDALAGRLSSQLPGDAAENRKVIFGESRAIRSATSEELKKEAVRIISEVKSKDEKTI